MYNESLIILRDRVCCFYYYYYKNVVCSILSILERRDGSSILNMMTTHSHVIIVHIYPVCSDLFLLALHVLLACMVFFQFFFLTMHTKCAALEWVTPTGMNFYTFLAFCFDFCTPVCMWLCVRTHVCLCVNNIFFSLSVICCFTQAKIYVNQSRSSALGNVSGERLFLQSTLVDINVSQNHYTKPCNEFT